jgi:acyl-CoA synthetase (AMP-forming)/AMP-acid ligase II
VTNPWRDPRVPASEECVLRPLLERRAADTPGKVLARFADGSTWTYRQASDAARRAAMGFRRLGVAQGDTVLSWLPNGPDALRVWFGLNYLGAVYVPVNLAYRGGILEHVVDRMKDAIRRRGENISSFEVETEVGAHPAVKEAAAVAVASDDGEDEVLVAVSLADGARLDPEDLIRFLLPRMAHFMVPRYVRVVDELPKTPTQKVQKHLLRTEGVTADTWDRAAAGIQVKRERIGATTAPGEERRAG